MPNISSAASALIRMEIGRQNRRDNTIAMEAGIDPASFSRKVRGNRRMTVDDFVGICQALRLDAPSTLGMSITAASIEGAHQ